MMHLVEVYVSVCLSDVRPLDNLQTVANIYFLFGSYVDWTKSSEEFAR